MNPLSKAHGGLRIAATFNKNNELTLDLIRAWCDKIGASAYVEISQEHQGEVHYIRIYANDLLHSLCRNADTSG